MKFKPLDRLPNQLCPSQSVTSANKWSQNNPVGLRIYSTSEWNILQLKCHKKVLYLNSPKIVDKGQTPPRPTERELGKCQLIFPGEQTNKNMFLIILIRVKPEHKLFCLSFWWLTKLSARIVLPSIIIAFKTANTAPTSMLLWAAAKRCLSQDDLIPGKGLPRRKTTNL